MKRNWIQMTVALSSATAILLTSATVWGEWGDGVQSGNFRLHPGIGLSAGFDSNLYYSSARNGGTPVMAPEAMIEPRLSLETINDGSWDLSGDASVGWRQYFSGEQVVRSQSGLSAGLNLSAWWNHDGAFSVRFTENFVRTNETPSYVSAQTINRIHNQAGIMFGLHPGGRVLETYASYDFSFYRHEQFSDLDRNTHHFGWNGIWSFLPKTAFVLDVDYRMIRYREPFVGIDRVPDPTQRLINADSNPLRLTGGVRGQITPRISATLRGGYGWGFYEEGPDVQAPLARAELSYQFGRIDFDNRLRAGYELGFRDSAIGNFYRFHRALAGYEQGFAGNRLRIGVQADAQMRNYAELGINRVETEDNIVLLPDAFSDLLLGVNGNVTYEIRKGWTVGGRYGFRSNFTEDVILIEGPAEDSLRDYQRHHLLLTTELTY